MDLSLKEIIEKTDNIHRTIDQLNGAIDFIQMKSELTDLFNLLKIVNSVSFKLSNIYNICSNKQKFDTNSYNKKNNIPYPINNDWVAISKEITPLSTYNNLTDDILINVKIVNDINDVPNIPLYWVSNINQYVTQINGIIFRGNIGNIYNKSHIKNNIVTNQIIICKYGNTCKKILNSDICKFYHDPLDLLSLLKEEKITHKVFNNYKKLYRNFLNTAWIYTDLPLNNNNKIMRHFGSRNTLKHEFDLIKINNMKTNDNIIQDFRQQCMHDILVIMGLNQLNLLK